MIGCFAYYPWLNRQERRNVRGSEGIMANMKRRIARLMRVWADRLDDAGAPKLVNLSFTFEDGIGRVIHSGPIASGKDQIGCQMAYLHEDDYKRAHSDAGRRDQRYESYPLTPDRTDRVRR